MKTINIKINIPTSFSEVRSWWKERISKRYRHNRQVLQDMENEICEEINSGYWSKDISEYMKKTLTSGPYGYIHTICRKYKRRLK